MNHNEQRADGCRRRALRRLRSRLTYANIVSTLYLLSLLVGGTAYAAHLVVDSSDVVDNSLTAADLATDSVGYDELAIGAVGSPQVRDGTVIGDDVRDDSLTRADIARNGIGFDEIAPNAVGSAHVVDDSLTTADLAVNSVDWSELNFNAVRSAHVQNGSLLPEDIRGGIIQGWSRVFSGLVQVEPRKRAFAIAPCPAGQRVLGGGFQLGDIATGLISSPTDSGDGWQVSGYNRSQSAQQMRAYAICANVTP